MLLQLFGQGAFVAASFAIGARLLRLWQRSRGAPELCIGLAFILGGGLGFLSWFVVAFAMLRGAGPEVRHLIALFGLACTCIGALCNGLGNARIFRPGRRWALGLVSGIAAGMAACFVVLLRAYPETGIAFWIAILFGACIYAWGALESMLLASILHRRARLGLADPIVVNRVFLWSIGNASIVTLISISFAAHLAFGGAALPSWISTLNAALGLVAAVSTWIGFFPPHHVRQRLARAYGN